MIRNALLLLLSSPGLCALLIACQSAPSAPEVAPASGSAAEAAPEPTSMPTPEGSAVPSGDGAAAPAAEEHAEHGAGHGDGRPGPLAAGETGHYGAPFRDGSAPMSLASAIETCAGTGQICKVEGSIERVCQRAGCWFTLAAPDVPRTVRVSMRNYGFFVPRNTPGATVVLEGTLEAVEVPQEVVQHYADDEAALTGSAAPQVTGPEQTYAFTIDGAQITMASAQ